MLYAIMLSVSAPNVILLTVLAPVILLKDNFSRRSCYCIIGQVRRSSLYYKPITIVTAFIKVTPQFRGSF